MSPRNCRPKQGYSLVEVTLAILVIGVGMVSVFGLFAGGLNMNRKAIDETRAAMFAEEVFAGYRAQVECDPDAWELLGDSSFRLGAPASNMWANSASIRIRPGSGTNVYENATAGGVEYALRYELTFAEVLTDRIKSGRLRVWNGQYGPMNLGDAVEFYTEFYNFKAPQ